MNKAYCVELKRNFVIGIDLPKNYFEYTWLCPICNGEVELVCGVDDNPNAGQWIHLVYNDNCPMIQNEKWDY